MQHPYPLFFSFYFKKRDLFAACLQHEQHAYTMNSYDASVRFLFISMSISISVYLCQYLNLHLHPHLQRLAQVATRPTRCLRTHSALQLDPEKAFLYPASRSRKYVKVCDSMTSRSISMMPLRASISTYTMRSTAPLLLPWTHTHMSTYIRQRTHIRAT